MSRLKKIFSTLILFIAFAGTAIAQMPNDNVDMADTMRASGKIYVVITVLSVVFIGIIVFLISIDRKVSKLEKEISERKK